MDYTPKMFLLSAIGLLTGAIAIKKYHHILLFAWIFPNPLHMRGKRAQTLTFLELKHALGIHSKS